MSQFDPFTWPGEIPESCPFELSRLLNGLHFLGTATDLKCGDTWYPSWASDDRLYSPWTDGSHQEVNPQNCDSWCRPDEPTVLGDITLPPPWYPNKSYTGQGMLIGDHPESLQAVNLGITEASTTAEFTGRYPCGSLVHDGIWYYGTYALGPDGWWTPPGEDRAYNWPVLGPFPGFRFSHDLGRTWTDTPHSIESPLFPEPDETLGPVKIGAPHFVDFGRSMEHSPDGKAYLVAHGSTRTSPPARYGHNSWITGDQVYLLRVTPSPETINDPGAYEFYAGTDAEGLPVWTSSFAEIQPVLEWEDHMGCVTVTWNPGLNKYIMCVTNGRVTNEEMDSYLLESDSLTGPWRIITYMKEFGPQAYFLNIPSKFIESDGLTFWLCYSGNFARQVIGDRDHPPGSCYGLVLQHVRFETCT
jgi:hypothetical protein